jgi:hypothetical protein
MIKRFTWLTSLVNEGAMARLRDRPGPQIDTFNPQAGHLKDFLVEESRANCRFEEFY